MLERGRGHVVNIASLAGKIPAPDLATYCATKHGVVGFTHSLRAEYGGEPVGFSAICPGFISRVGMYGRFEHQVGERLAWSAPLPPERVGDAVVRAIRQNLPEVIVSQAPGATARSSLNAVSRLALAARGRPRPSHPRSSRERFAQAREPSAELEQPDWPFCFNRWTRERRWS